LIPTFQPLSDGGYTSARRKNSTTVAVKSAPVNVAVQPVKGRLLTQHTGLPPRLLDAKARKGGVKGAK
jgi:hypothetical protein